MNLLDVSFHNTLWLYLLAPAVGVVGWLFWLGHRRRQQLLGLLIHPRMLSSFTAQVSKHKRQCKTALMLATVFLLVLTLARPQLGYVWEETPQQSVDILIALDTSRSMLAPDIRPDRMTRSKLAIEAFALSIEGVRLGLIPFAGDAFLWCPLTYDKEAFLQSLRAVDTRIIPVGGTNLISAVETAERSFLRQPDALKMLILVTDGEDLSGMLDAKLPDFAQKGWVIHTIGVGTEAGELIPVLVEDGSSRFVTDPQGNVVRSRLDRPTLEQIAEVTGAAYHALGPTGEGLIHLFEQSIQPTLAAREETRLRRVMIDRYAWLVALAIVLLMIELLLPERRRRARSEIPSQMAIFLALCCLCVPFHSEASSSRQAQKAFDAGKFESAFQLYEEAYRQSGTPRLGYNAAVSALLSGDAEAARLLTGTPLEEGNPDLQEKTFYNRGNAHYWLGRNVLDIDPIKTIEHWEAALSDFEAAMEINPTAEDARFNYEEVSRLLEKLKEILQHEQEGDSGEDTDSDEESEQDSDEQRSDPDSSQDQQDPDPSGESQEDPSEDTSDPHTDNDSDTEDTDQPEDQEKNDPNDQPSDCSDPTEAEAEPDLSDRSDPADANIDQIIQLLDALKEEEGDYRDFHFKTQPEPVATDWDW